MGRDSSNQTVNHLAKNRNNRVVLPGGIMVGERYVDKDGKLKLHYKQGHKSIDITIRQAVEYISGCEVEKIIYKNP